MKQQKEETADMPRVLDYVEQKVTGALAGNFLLSFISFRFLREKMIPTLNFLCMFSIAEENVRVASVA